MRQFCYLPALRWTATYSIPASGVNVLVQVLEEKNVWQNSFDLGTAHDLCQSDGSRQLAGLSQCQLQLASVAVFCSFVLFAGLVCLILFYVFPFVFVAIQYLFACSFSFEQPQHSTSTGYQQVSHPFLPTAAECGAKDDFGASIKESPNNSCTLLWRIRCNRTWGSCSGKLRPKQEAHLLRGENALLMRWNELWRILYSISQDSQITHTTRHYKKNPFRLVLRC